MIFGLVVYLWLSDDFDDISIIISSVLSVREASCSQRDCRLVRNTNKSIRGWPPPKSLICCFPTKPCGLINTLKHSVLLFGIWERSMTKTSQPEKSVPSVKHWPHWFGCGSLCHRTPQDKQVPHRYQIISVVSHSNSKMYTVTAHLLLSFVVPFGLVNCNTGETFSSLGFLRVNPTAAFSRVVSSTLRHWMRHVAIEVCREEK